MIFIRQVFNKEAVAAVHMHVIRDKARVKYTGCSYFAMPKNTHPPTLDVCII